MNLAFSVDCSIILLGLVNFLGLGNFVGLVDFNFTSPGGSEM